MPGDREGTPSVTKVIAILSCRYSGSTILDLMLGSHRGALSLTELRRYVAFRKSKFYCKVCTPPECCPVWTPALTAELVRLGPCPQVYRLLAESTGCELLIDSSKIVGDWFARTLVGLPPEDVLCVLISKSPEEYAGSERTKTGSRRPHTTFDIASVWWRTNAELLDFVDRCPYRTAVVRYRDLVDHPGAVLGALLAPLGRAYEPGAERFWEYPHHPLWGNSGSRYHLLPAESADQALLDENELGRRLYAERHRQLFRDEKWRELLTRAEVDALYAVGRTEAVARLLGYAHPFTDEGRRLNERQAQWQPVPVIGTPELRRERRRRSLDVWSWPAVEALRRHGVLGLARRLAVRVSTRTDAG